MRAPWLVQLFLALCLAGVFRLWPLRAYRCQRADGAPAYVQRLRRWRLIGIGLTLAGLAFLPAAELLVGFMPGVMGISVVSAADLPVGGAIIAVSSLGLGAYRRHPGPVTDALREGDYDYRHQTAKYDPRS